MKPIKRSLTLTLGIVLLIGLAQAAMAANYTYEVTQGSVTTTVTPLSGTETATAFYDYRNLYPHTGYEKADASRIFLYKDPAGTISLVMVHDKSGTGTTAGTAVFDFSGVPSGTTFIVRDDGSEASLPTSNWDWLTDGADGGVLSGTLNGTFTITITPSGWSGINSWEWLSWNPSLAVRTLNLNSRITIRAKVANSAPTDISLSASTVNENSPGGTVVGTLTASDPDAGNTHTFTLTDNAGGRFQVAANQLQVATGANLNYEIATSHSITVRATDQGGLSFSKSFVIGVTGVNEAPNDIALDNASVLEASPGGTVVGNLSATDPEAGDTHTFTLADSAGGRFQIVGNQLQVAAGANLDYAVAPSHNVTVQATDQGGLSFSKNFTISVSKAFNVAPTDITLNGATVPENSPGGTLVGNLSATDPEVGDTHTFSLTDNAGGRFQISGNQLQVAPAAVLDFEAMAAFNVTIRATDRGGLTLDKSFAIALSNVNEAPTGIALSNTSVAENSPAATVIGLLSATEVDAGDIQTFSLTSNAGGRFQIAGNQLQVAAGAVLDF